MQLQVMLLYVPQPELLSWNDRGVGFDIHLQTILPPDVLLCTAVLII